MQGDDSDEVQTIAKSCIENINNIWLQNYINSINTDDIKMDIADYSHIVDGELELQKIKNSTNSNTTSNTTTTTTTSNTNNSSTNNCTAMDITEDTNSTQVINNTTHHQQQYHIFKNQKKGLSSLFLLGITSWTIDSRRRYIKGLTIFISYIGGNELIDYLTDILNQICILLVDDNSSIKSDAEKCCIMIGMKFSIQDIIAIVIPRADGTISGNVRLFIIIIFI